jgi:hypothetical protein
MTCDTPFYQFLFTRGCFPNSQPGKLVMSPRFPRLLSLTSHVAVALRIRTVSNKILLNGRYAAILSLQSESFPPPCQVVLEAEIEKERWLADRREKSTTPPPIEQCWYARTAPFGGGGPPRGRQARADRRSTKRPGFRPFCARLSALDFNKRGVSSANVRQFGLQS